MKTLSSICLLFLLRCCLIEAAGSQTLLLINCSINVHLEELHKYYSSIRPNAITADEEIGVQFLNKSLIDDVQVGQRCCFLRLVLGFYVEKVFRSCMSSQQQDPSSLSSLANTFITIRKEMLQCHCLCEDETQKRVDSLHDAFSKLEISKAAQKAVGELGTVLEWLHHSSQKTVS